MILLILIFGTTLLFAIANREIFEWELSRKIDIVALILMFIGLIFILTPISFIGGFLDKFLAFCIYTYLILKWSLRKRDNIKSVKKRIWGLVGFEIIFGLYLFIAIFTGDYFLCRIQPKKVTFDKEYRLVHRKTNSDFMYSGDHMILIHKKIKGFPILEKRIKKLNVGSYFDNYEPPMLDYSIESDSLNIINTFSGGIRKYSIK